MALSKLTVETEFWEHHDKATLDWTIPNFNDVYNTTKRNGSRVIAEGDFTIYGGEGWEFSLEHNDENIGICLHYLGYDCYSAEYIGYLKSSEGKFIKALDVGLHKYDGSINEGSCESWGLNKWKSLSQLNNEGFISDSDGTLHFKLHVSVYSGTSLLKMNAIRNFREAYTSPEGSDVTFNFVEEGAPQKVLAQIKAHRGILCKRSRVFATMLGSGLKETTTGEVEINDMTPKAMGILLNYIYSAEVDSEWGSVAEELFKGADKYDLPDLQEHLCKYVDSVLTVKNVLKIRNSAKLYNLPSVLKSTSKFISENVDGVLDHNELVPMETVVV